jgi:hypothetical protein
MDGSKTPNTRTTARVLYTTMLRAKYHWADIPDLHIFLMGFDAGEQWTLHTQGIETDTHGDGSWLTENKLGNVWDILDDPARLSAFYDSSGLS